MTVSIPFDKGLLLKMVHERCQVIRERYVQEGLVATVKADERMAQTLAPYYYAVDDEGQGPSSVRAAAKDRLIG
jgi:GTP-binding protein HflX